jgi:tetratricopeptide (TPR) repeat protein
LEQQGQFDRVIERQKEMLKLHPDDGYLHVELFRLYLRKNMYKEASFHMDAGAVAFGFPELAEAARRARAVGGNLAAIRASLAGWERMVTTHQIFIPVNLADVYAALGDKDRAFYWLEWAYAHQDIGIAADDLGLRRLNMEFLLEPLRSDPRFKDLVRRVGLPQVQLDESGAERRTTLVQQ